MKFDNFNFNIFYIFILLNVCAELTSYKMWDKFFFSLSNRFWAIVMQTRLRIN